jgi:hypothetical protein
MVIYPRFGENNMVESKGKDWRELCAEAAEEPDSQRVVSLVNQILQAFDDCDQNATAVSRHGRRDFSSERHRDLSPQR